MEWVIDLSFFLGLYRRCLVGNEQNILICPKLNDRDILKHKWWLELGWRWW